MTANIIALLLLFIVTLIAWDNRTIIKSWLQGL